MSLKQSKLTFNRVEVKGNSKESLEFALRLWKKRVKESGVLQEYRDRMEYVKPSIIKRDIKARAINRQQIETNNEKEMFG